MKLTLRLLWDGQTKPLQIDAVLAADAWSPASKRMERNGAYDQRQLKKQLGGSRDIDTHLVVQDDDKFRVGWWGRQIQYSGEVYSANKNWKQSGNCAHLKHVFHFNDATLQDGRTHGRNLDCATVPRLPAPGAHHVAAQRGHHGALLLHGAAGDEGLSLSDVRFGHDWPRSRIVKLRENRDDLACGDEGGGCYGRVNLWITDTSIIESRYTNMHVYFISESMSRCIFFRNLESA